MHTQNCKYERSLQIKRLSLPGKLYIIGGFDNDNVRYDARLLSMDIDTGETLTLTSMANARTYPGVATSEGRIFVFGGYCSEEMMKCEMYDVAEDR